MRSFSISRMYFLFIIYAYIMNKKYINVTINSHDVAINNTSDDSNNEVGQQENRIKT